jgi:hypothetical protein
MAMGLREDAFGLLMAVGFVLGGFSSQMAHRLDGKVNTHRAPMLAWAMAVCARLGAAVRVGWQGVALLIVGGTCIYGIAAPRVSEAINRHVGSERRATILSTQTLFSALLYIPLGAILGDVSTRWGVQVALLVLAGWLSFGGVCFAFWRLRSK